MSGTSRQRRYFLTVGSQEPFDRLVRAVDAWAGEAAGCKVFAQTAASRYEPRHIGHTDFLTPAAFRAHVAKADLVIAHAGMGSILNALEVGTPLLVMPRSGRLGETRNDHQQDTAFHLLERGLVTVAWDEDELVRRLRELDQLPEKRPLLGPYAEPRLLERLRAFLME